MKLRVRGNSIRLRLSQHELSALLTSGAVEEGVNFPSGQSLRYRLESVPGATPQAEFASGRVTVRFGRDAVAAWSDPAQVSLEAEQALPGGERLKLLVEKDFRCLADRDGEDDTDLFPNPGA